MNKFVVLSPEREIPLLLFLWKWKVSTTAALTKRFFPKCSPKTAYNRLLALRQVGMIQMRSDGLGQHFLCSLDKKGFEGIRRLIPEMKEEGYKSEAPEHDLLVSAFQLGEWLGGQPQGAVLFSEQQLRRYHPEYYPEWAPKTDVHRPDGYTSNIVDGRRMTFAYEVELSHKRDEDYLKIAEFYNHYRNIHRVLWLVPRRSMAEGILTRMEKVSTQTTVPHSFALVDGLTSSAWDTKIQLGLDEGKTLRQVVTGKVQESASIPAGSILALSLLDTRKSPHTSNSYRGYQLGVFRD